MKTIFKEKILDKMAQEISLAEMNSKIISHFIITSEEETQLKHEMKMKHGWKEKLHNSKIYGILVLVEDEDLQVPIKDEYVRSYNESII
jgi:hypothetical protein